jgi:nucleotide-binding universal stress UspA family protein
MKILLAIDGSGGGRAALEQAIARPWPAGTEIRVVSVAHTNLPILVDPALTFAAVRHEMLERDRERAARDVDEAAKVIRASASELNVTSRALEGVPKEAILDEAERWGADLILLGSHGHGAVKRFLLGSVTQAVVVHAACSVEVVRRVEISTAT